MVDVVYANRAETFLRSRKSTAKSAIQEHLLMGTWLRVLNEAGDWFEVEDRPRKRVGFAHRDEVSESTPLKIFYVDVGQGDGAIIESPQGILLIDGGPNKAYYEALRKRAQPVIDDGEGPVHIEAIVMSHPDDDHFVGLTHLLRDPDFTFGRIYHNGIIRYRKGTGHGSLNLGRMSTTQVEGRDVAVLAESYNTIDQVKALLDEGHLMARFAAFWTAAHEAHEAGRLQHACRRLTHRDDTLPGFAGDPAHGLRVEVLAPVVTRDQGPVHYLAFPDPETPSGAASDSHTINGHSIVLKLSFHAHSFLFGGDLNIPAQRHLLDHYQDEAELFQVDVNKACHHGSSDFDVEFLKQVTPHATVFSSGEDRLHDHPLPDALGAATRHAQGDYPLLFSTELARTPLGGEQTLKGDINARSNGETLVMAQKKERGKKDPWHSFHVPFEGRFTGEDD